jgi:hypothetical protein
MPKEPKPLTREGEPKQKTKNGLENPVPKSEDFDRLLRNAAKKQGQQKPAQQEA